MIPSEINVITAGREIDLDLKMPEESELPKQPARRSSDRRKHPRYTFIADAEIVETVSGTQIGGRVADLSQRGCYVQCDRVFAVGTAVNVRISKESDGFVAYARVVSASPTGMGLAFDLTDDDTAGLLEFWFGPLREKDWLVRNRRRSQRMLLSISVRIIGTEFQENTHTDTINAAGALIRLGATVQKGQRLKIVNAATKEEAECSVTYISREKKEKFEVGIAFILPNPNFWRVTFPPET